MDVVDGDDDLDGVDSTYNQPPSPRDRARASPTHNSPYNLERYRLFPTFKVPLIPASSSSYSAWRSNQPSRLHTSLHRDTTKSTLSSDPYSRSLASPHPAPTTAPTDPATFPTNAPVFAAAAPAPTSLCSTLHPGVPRNSLE
jgi:hypothetical protein